MNATVYVFGQFSGDYNQFPADYTQSIFKEFYKHSKSTTQIAIHRETNLMYYAYIRKLSQEQYLGICFVVNGLLLTRIDSLFPVFEKLFTELVERGQLVELNERGELVSRVNQLYLNREQIDSLKSSLLLELNRSETVKLPPLSYNLSNTSVKDFTISDNMTTIANATSQYAYTYVYKEKNYNTPNLNAYISTLKELYEEKKEWKDKCTSLQMQLKKAKNQQRNIKWVSLLLIVSFALFGVIWNKVLFPSEVTKYQTGEFIYYGPLDSSKRPHGIGVAIYPQDDPQHRRYYVGNFNNGVRQDEEAMLLYQNGSYFYGKMEGDVFQSGTFYNIDDMSSFVGNFNENKPYEGIHYIHEKVYSYHNGTKHVY